MSVEFTVLSLNISVAKGTAKHPVQDIEVTAGGLEGDAHSGEWHRQISILDSESVDAFAHRTGLVLEPGDFGENITSSGIDIGLLTPGTLVSGPGGLLLEVTQVGKECHGDDCTVFRKVGKCIMPARGVFCRVIHGGHLHKGDILKLLNDERTP